MTDSPLQNANDVVSIDIRSNGKSIPDTFEVFTVRTRCELNSVAEALIVVADGDAAAQEFPVADSDEFKPGAEIEIQAGYASRNKSIFKGVVTAVRLKIDGASGSRLEITCQHKAAVLLQGPRQRVFKAGRKDSVLISDVLDAAGISADVQSTSVELPEIVQLDATDWNFIVNRAEENGMVVACTENGLFVGAPALGESAKLEVTFGVDLIAMDMEISVHDQYPGFESSAWNPSTQGMEIDGAKNNNGNVYGNLGTSDLADVHSPKPLSVASSLSPGSTGLGEIARARALRSELAVPQGSVTFQGNASLKPNNTLELAALGKRFSGKGLVSGVRHHLEEGNWETEVQIGLPAVRVSDKTGSGAPMINGLANGSRGLVIGKVTQLDKDPDGLSRIQVAIHEFDQGATPLWARLGASYASGGAGCMFLPEIDDEVIVGFFNDNPSSPVVLGSLHNPKANPPEGFVQYDNGNNTKAIVTRENLRITFDEEKKILALGTPGGNKVVLDDDSRLVRVTDQNGNTVALDGSGIVLDSAGDIVMKAKGKIDIKASRDLSVSGANVSAMGSAGFKASGGTSAELSAGGNTTVKGSLVQIN